MPKYTKAEVKEAVEGLQQMFRSVRDSRVYLVLRRVSRSGMVRHISVVFIHPDGYALHPNWAVSRVTGYRLVSRDGHDAIHIGGCGMDMGFALVDDLNHALTNLTGQKWSLRHEWL